jgi:UTP:GlnB (protein PII) uridylyltransferase
MKPAAMFKDDIYHNSGFQESASSIEPLGGTLYKLDLNDRFPAGWMARLSTGLADSKISVVSFKAEKTSAMDWTAALVLDFAISPARPDKTDYLKLAKATSTRLSAIPVSLGKFSFEKSSKHGGCIYIELTGTDRVGFLADLISMFSMYSLNPAEIDIKTSGSTVFDRFWLKGMGGSVPSEAASKAVYEKLTSYCS